MSWVYLTEREPKHNQWIVIAIGEQFKVGQYDKNHPFAPCIVDREAGRFYRGFQFWKPLSKPKGLKP